MKNIKIMIERENHLTPEAKQILGYVYGALWAEGYYDALNESTEKFARPLADKMSRLNEILKFKV